jgi:hypothetical protein
MSLIWTYSVHIAPSHFRVQIVGHGLQCCVAMLVLIKFFTQAGYLILVKNVVETMTGRTKKKKEKKKQPTIVQPSSVCLSKSVPVR